MSEPERRTTICRACHAQCSLVVEMAEGRPVKLYGDKDNPVYAGFSCIKGRELAAYHASPSRLLASRRRRADGGFDDISSAAMMDAIAEKVRRLVAEHGPRSVALYIGTHGYNNFASSAFANAFLTALGSPMKFTSVTIDQPGKAISLMLHGPWLAGVPAMEHWDVLALVGTNPIVSMNGGLGMNPARRLHQARQRGMKLVVIDPRRTDCAELADIPLAVKPGEDSDEEVVYDKREEFEIAHPKDGRAMPAKFLFTVDNAVVRESDLRESLAGWLTARGNPLFAKSMANRMWSYFFGKGIIDPVDDIRASNPPSNPALLDALTQDFLDHDYDLKHLIRTILNSRTYQLSFRTNQWNGDDETNFSHAYPRRLSAEQLFDGIHIAAGARPKFELVPVNSMAQDVPDPTIAHGGFLDIFGRPERQTSCECERRSDVSLVQALNLLNGSTIADAIAAPEGRITKLVLSGVNNRQLVEEIYLAALSRAPEAAELDYALTYLAKGGARAERAQDLMWALLNSNAFLFNR